MEILKVDFDKTESDPLIFKSVEIEKIEKTEKTDKSKTRILSGLKDRDIDELVINSCKTIRDDVASKAKNENQDSNFTEFTPIKAKSQVVAGTNLFVKVKVDANKFIHTRIWCKLDSSIELINIQWNKNENDEIAYF